MTGQADNQASFLFLGTGGSMGVPVIGCDCPVCTSGKATNQRSRPSALIQWQGKHILIDCGPDFRWQALRFGIKNIDGVILTHAHNDHTAGFDELRLFYFKHQAPVPCLLSKATETDLARRFFYIFHPEGPYEEFIPKFALTYLRPDQGNIIFLGLPITYFSYEQGGMEVHGLRFGSVAYVTDIRHYRPAIIDHLKGLDCLILSALRYTKSPLHLNLDEAIDLARQTGAKKVYFTHMAHDLDYDHANAYLPENMQLAYDGLQLQFDPFKL